MSEENGDVWVVEVSKTVIVDDPDVTHPLTAENLVEEQLGIDSHHFEVESRLASKVDTNE